MKITLLTLFPDMFRGPFDASIIKNAEEKGLVHIKYVNIRDFGIGSHKMVDDTPYGGGVGMVMRVDVVHEALKNSINPTIPAKKRKIILMSAHGTPFTQKKANELATLDELIIICGHYEGIDSRIENYIDEEISIGDFVTTGGEIPAMLIVDAVARRIPGVLKDEATLLESFQEQGGQNLLEHAHYTKPAEYDGKAVPEVLLSGNHKLINEWRNTSAHEATKKKRPDIMKK